MPNAWVRLLEPLHFRFLALEPFGSFACLQASLVAFLSPLLSLCLCDLEPDLCLVLVPDSGTSIFQEVEHLFHVVGLRLLGFGAERVEPGPIGRVDPVGDRPRLLRLGFA